MNRTIAQTLRTLVAKDQSNWHKLIPSVMMALRMSTNTESTGYSPFQMLFGKEMNLPFDISVQPKDGMSKTAKNHLETLIDRLKIVKDIAKTSVENSQEKTKNRYDKKAEAPKFRVGDYVMLQSMKVPKGLSPKLHPKWDGPFYVINVGQNNTCKLRRCSDHKLIKSRIHTNRMKPYIDPRDHRTIPDIQRNVAQNNRDRVDDIDDVQNDNIDSSQNDDEQMQQNDAHMQQNDALLQQNDETNDEDNDFIAEKLLAKKRRQGKNYYKVKWVGYKKTTWEPEENIGEAIICNLDPDDDNEISIGKPHKGPNDSTDTLHENDILLSNDQNFELINKWLQHKLLEFEDQSFGKGNSTIKDERSMVFYHFLKLHGFVLPFKHEIDGEFILVNHPFMDLYDDFRSYMALIFSGLYVVYLTNDVRRWASLFNHTCMSNIYSNCIITLNEDSNYDLVQYLLRIRNPEQEEDYNSDEPEE
ncbi:unnamed protein product [Mytilus edulis]|uniref:Chromo domain-containing protein n=1 Tax=Mytilus edulis TaxID=6550 RepID=A0A8S3TWA1_MYTED|nr:unnamed protein product [Mytilus edulis]